MSSEGSATRAKPTVFSPVSVGSPPCSRAMSVLVPPMSNVTRSPRPVSWATWRPAAMPPAGPDSTAPAARRADSLIGATPPCDCMISTSRAKPCARSRAARLAR